jgi:putative sterol carrier protein
MITPENIDEFNSCLAPRYEPALLDGRTLRFQFTTDSGCSFHLVAGPVDCRFEAGEVKAPSIRLYVDEPRTVFDLLTGRLDGMDAFMEGRYRSDGHIVLSQLLLYLFRRHRLHAADVRD